MTSEELAGALIEALIAESRDDDLQVAVITQSRSGTIRVGGSCCGDCAKKLVDSAAARMALCEKRGESVH